MTGRDPFVALDFETADPARDSACQVGLCRVEGGAVVYRDAVFIRPPRRSFHPQCVAVHGITWAKVANADPWAAAWPKLLPVFAGAARIAAHNASFDKGVLEACCKAAGITPPATPWVCTLKLAQARWPKPLGNKLPEVCTRLGVPLLAHHDAGADAEMCARVLLALEGGGGADAPTLPTGLLDRVRQLARSDAPGLSPRQLAALSRLAADAKAGGWRTCSATSSGPGGRGCRPARGAGARAGTCCRVPVSRASGRKPPRGCEVPRKIDWLDYAHQLDKEREAIADKAGDGYRVTLTLSAWGYSTAEFSLTLTHVATELAGYGHARTPAKALEAAKRELAKKVAEEGRQPRLVAATPKALPPARPAATLFGGADQ